MPAKTLVVLKGDGVGPEVIGAALRVLDRLRERGLAVEVDERPFGAAAWQAAGAIMSGDTRTAALAADAVLFGAQGGPDYERMPEEVRRAQGLLRLRRDMDVFANLRPVRVPEALLDVSPLKPEVVRGTDMVIVRELTSGLYFGRPRGIDDLGIAGRRGIDTQIYTDAEIRRVARAAFELARTRRGRVTCVDKSNVLASGALWRREIAALHAEAFADVELDFLLADNAGLQLVRDPGRFDVIVADNMFGDLLSDVAAGAIGSLGMLPSASLGAPDTNGRRRALYEPVHGSAPDIAGQGIANPLAAILSVAMALRYSLEAPDEAARLEAAVDAALAAGVRTPDICPPGVNAAGTESMTDAVIAALDREA